MENNKSMRRGGRNISDPWICGTELLRIAGFGKDLKAAVTFRVTLSSLKVVVKLDQFNWTRKFTASELSKMIPSVAERIGEIIAEETLVRKVGHVDVKDLEPSN